MMMYLQPNSICLALTLASKLCQKNKELTNLMQKRETELANSTLVSCSINPEKERKAPQYDEFHNDPVWVNGHLTCLWETVLLNNHFHPSVAKFANQLISQESILYDGDPITDFSAMSFLDKFVHKKEKKLRTEQVQQVQAEFSKKPSPFRPPISLSEEETPKKIYEDETFFHDFYQTVKQLEAKNKKKNQIEDEKTKEEKIKAKEKKTTFDYSDLSGKDYEDEFDMDAEDSEEFLDDLVSDEDEEDEEDMDLDNLVEDQGHALGDILESNLNNPKYVLFSFFFSVLESGFKLILFFFLKKKRIPQRKNGRKLQDQPGLRRRKSSTNSPKTKSSKKRECRRRDHDNPLLRIKM